MRKPAIRHLVYRSVSDLKPNPRNPRKHRQAQIRALAKSMETFGFNSPILTDAFGNVVAGHGRLEAAKLAGLTTVPVICLEDLTEAQAQAYMMADNRFTDLSDWDEKLLAVHLKELSDLALEFDIEARALNYQKLI